MTSCDFEASFKPVDKVFDQKTGRLSSFVVRSPLLAVRKCDGQKIPGLIYPEEAPNNKGYALRFYPDCGPKNVTDVASQSETYIGFPEKEIADCGLQGSHPASVEYIEGGNAISITILPILSNVAPPGHLEDALEQYNAEQHFYKILRIMALLNTTPSGCLLFRHSKRGTSYVLTGYSTLQLDGPYDMNVVFHYSDASGNKWTRLASEFLDGRFSSI